MRDACPRCGLFHPAGSPCLALQLAAQPADGLQAGTLLAGRYQIQRTIHRGGMSTVYLAEDTLLHGRPVALKELRPPADASVEEAHEAEVWFARESALLSGLRHPLIPAFYSVFREDGRSYIAQEYIEGENLEEVVRSRGPVAPDQVVSWGIALCGLLEYLHSLPEPVIFRDLKPANVLLRAAWSAADRRLGVVDFGIARHFREGTVGTVIGTPGYAPPEQYQGLATPQSDVYALGATLHRLLTGYDPEHGAPFTFPPIRDLNPAVSPPLAAAVERAVALNPADRYATAGDFGAELGKLRPRLVQASARGRAGAAARGRAGAWIAAALLLFPLVLSQAFRSTGTTMPLSVDQGPPATSGGPYIGAQDVGTPCTRPEVAGQPSSTTTCGPDGNIWFIDPVSPTRIDRVDAEGGVTSYSIPTQYGTIESITAGSFACQCIWLAGSAGVVLKMDTFAGGITALPLPAGRPTQISGALEPDGDLWLALQGRPNQLVRVAPDGSEHVLALPDGTAPSAITVGSDGNLWFTVDRSAEGQAYGAIGRITPLGALKEWRTPTPGSTPRGIAPGPDGNLWFTEEQGDAIGRITTDGQITEFALPTPDSQPVGIVAAPDGGMWFAEMGVDRIGRIPVYGASSAAIASYALPRGSRPHSLAYGPDGIIWWTGEGAGSRVGSLSLDGTVQVLDTSTSIDYQVDAAQQ